MGAHRKPLRRPVKRGSGSASSERAWGPPSPRGVAGLRRVLSDLHRPAPHRFRRPPTGAARHSRGGVPRVLLAPWHLATWHPGTLAAALPSEVSPPGGCASETAPQAGKTRLRLSVVRTRVGAPIPTRCRWPAPRFIRSPSASSASFPTPTHRGGAPFARRSPPGLAGTLAPWHLAPWHLGCCSTVRGLAAPVGAHRKPLRRPVKRGSGSASSERAWGPPSPRGVAGLRRVLSDLHRPAPHRFRRPPTGAARHSRGGVPGSCWHLGTLAPWHPGTLAPWHPGTDKYQPTTTTS